MYNFFPKHYIKFSLFLNSKDKVLAIINQIMDELLVDERACRAYRAKFPEEVLQESLAGQLW